ncbi:NACHT domain-containing protein [Vibrio alginolyticus]|nr:NACHT domain-containing protein [Vibrio alginolyticus]
MLSGMQEKTLLSLASRSYPSIVSYLKLKKENLEHYCEHKFLPYIVDQYEQLNLSTTILFRNHRQSISDIYIPLTLIDSEDEHHYKINSFPHSLIKRKTKILINDNAGMGKSTLLKMIFRYAIDSGSCIPFYIDLKTLIKDDKVIDVVEHLVGVFPSFTNVPSKDFVKCNLENSSYLFLFDGADEVPDKHKAKLFKEINDFTDKAKHSRFIVATRKEDRIKSNFLSFFSLNIKPLEKKEAYDLLYKCNFENVDAEKLIEEIEKPENRAVSEFLENPLLTTLLYTAYAYKRAIPLKKNLFYKQIYDALYEGHDATKTGYFYREKKSGLGITQFEEILSSLAFIGRSEERLEYGKYELEDIIKRISSRHPTINFSPRDFIEDITLNVPVFKKEGDTYSWQHKSIQEYFFVRRVALEKDNEKKTRLIKNIVLSSASYKFKLVLDILYDECEVLFHDAATRCLLKTLQNKGVTIHSDIKQDFDEFDILYKYVCIPKNDPRLEELDFDGNIFEKIEKVIRNQYELELENYTTNSVMLSNRDSIAYFDHPCTIVADILFEKGHDFITLTTIPKNKIERERIKSILSERSELSRLYASNVERKAKKEEVQLIYFKNKAKRVCYRKLLSFIKDFDRKDNEYNNMFSDFLI